MTVKDILNKYPQIAYITIEVFRYPVNPSIEISLNENKIHETFGISEYDGEIYEDLVKLRKAIKESI